MILRAAARLRRSLLPGSRPLLEEQTMNKTLAAACLAALIPALIAGCGAQYHAADVRAAEETWQWLIDNGF